MCGLRWRLLAVGGKPDAALSQRLSSHGLAYMPLEAYKYKIYAPGGPQIQNTKETRTNTNYAPGFKYERDLQIQNMLLDSNTKEARTNTNMLLDANTKETYKHKKCN